MDYTPERKAYMKARYLRERVDHPEKFEAKNAYLKEYAAKKRAENIEEYRARGREDQKKWRAANLEKAKKTERAWKMNRRLNSPIDALLCSARARAKKKGLEYNLEASDLFLPSHCPVLGIPIMLGQRIGCPNSPSLDRMDNSKGYVKGNVMIISRRANTLKNDASLAELLKVCEYAKRIEEG